MPKKRRAGGDHGKPCAYTINEAEAKIVRLIYQWYVYGDDAGNRLSQMQIGMRLSEMGIPRPSAHPSKMPGRPAVRPEHIWHRATVNDILRNESYAGTMRYGKHIGRSGDGGHRPTGEQIAIAIPPIVPHEMWVAAQGQGRRNWQHAKRNTQYRTYVLRGMIRCKCGMSIYGLSKQSGNHRRFYYGCCGRTNRYKGLEQVCQQKDIPAEVLENFVWDYITSAVSNSHRYEEALRKAQKNELDSIEPKLEQLKIVEDQIAEDDRVFTNIAAELARGVTDKVRDALNQRAAHLEPLYNARLKTREELQAAISQMVYTEERIETALEFRADVQAGIENATIEDKQRWCQTLQVNVTVKGNKAKVRCMVLVKAKEIALDTSTV